MITNKKILVLGMARSGIAIAKLLARYHNEITITDLKEQENKITEELKELNINVVITDNQEQLVDNSYDLIVKNPAIPRNNKTVEKAKKLNIPVINEVEASYKFLPTDVTIIGITGSNGKTTTTTITYELLKKTKHSVHLGGNIGIPLASIVENIKSGDILLLEISDHQLCDMYEFKTDISVLTNLSEVHIDFHGSYETYKNTKKKIFNNHTQDSVAIINKEDKEVLNLIQDIPSKKLYFSSKQKADIYLANNQIVYEGENIMNCQDIKLRGTHNYENIMVAILISKMFGIKNEDICDILRQFKGVEHRMEFVKELNGRKFYNDSKATNNQSTIIALDSFKEPTILIMGGLDRNIPFDSIAPHLRNVKYIICYGETKDKIKEFAESNGKNALVLDDLVEGTKKAYELSEPGDIILLSPACASWDQYQDFEVRGKVFKATVLSLK